MAKKWAAAGITIVAIVIIVVALNAFGAQKSDQAPSVGALSLTIVAGIAILLGMLALVGIAYSIAGIANTKEAFALPEGSVRALLALLITIGFIVVAFPQVVETQPPATPPPVTPQKQSPPPAQSSAPQSHAFLSFFDTSAYAQTPPPATDSNGAGAGKTNSNSTNDLPKQVLQILGTLMTTIVGFYFGSKTTSDATKKVGDVVQQAMTNQQNAQQLAVQQLATQQQAQQQAAQAAQRPPSATA